MGHSGQQGGGSGVEWIFQVTPINNDLSRQIATFGPLVNGPIVPFGGVVPNVHRHWRPGRLRDCLGLNYESKYLTPARNPFNMIPDLEEERVAFNLSIGG